MFYFSRQFSYVIFSVRNLSLITYSSSTPRSAERFMICSKKEMKILSFLFIEIYFLSKLCIRQKNSFSEMRFNEHTFITCVLFPLKKKNKKRKFIQLICTVAESSRTQPHNRQLDLFPNQ